ncbi:MAG: hypothetical protein LBP55_03585 [Candidatus Adiutrix sp.]|jgi:hypothetical protein|nr:hypothetical protein [Candidatus Adiutrix sp.]
MNFAAMRDDYNARIDPLYEKELDRQCWLDRQEELEQEAGRYFDDPETEANFLAAGRNRNQPANPGSAFARRAMEIYPSYGHPCGKVSQPFQDGLKWAGVDDE